MLRRVNWQKFPTFRKERIDECWMRKRTNLKDSVTVADSVQWKWGGPVTRTDQHRSTHYTNVGRKERQQETWASEDAVGRCVQESSGRTTVAISHEPDRRKVRRTSGSNCADISIKWLHECIQWCKCQPTRRKWNLVTCSKSQCDSCKYSSLSDKTLEFFLVPPGGWWQNGIN